MKENKTQTKEEFILNGLLRVFFNSLWFWIIIWFLTTGASYYFPNIPTDILMVLVGVGSLGYLKAASWLIKITGYKPRK